MFVTRKHLTRRTVLRGLGATLGLPLLDAMIPARTALAQTAAKPAPRMGFIYFPHGAVMNRWTPTGEGQIGELGDILKPLEKYKAMTTVFSNIDNQAPIGPVHALSPGTWLCSNGPRSSIDATGCPSIARMTAGVVMPAAPAGLSVSRPTTSAPAFTPSRAAVVWSSGRTATPR